MKIQSKSDGNVEEENCMLKPPQSKFGKRKMEDAIVEKQEAADRESKASGCSTPKSARSNLLYIL
jgi:hypothetical protein